MTKPLAMSFDAFVEAAWNDHGDRPQEVADRLGSSLHLAVAPEHIAQLARLATHVFGEHLGQWQRGIDTLNALRSLPAFDGSAACVGALTRGIAMLRHAAGDAAALEALGLDDRVCVLASAAAALAGRNEFGRAISTYTDALALADRGLPRESAAIRALAVGGNNLAAALEQKRDRDSYETAGMLVAAEGGLEYWKLAGTWLEEERAEYRLARSLLQAGRPEAALRSAGRCIAICEDNAAPPFERFFGHAVLALAQRDAGDDTASAASRREALRWFEQVPQPERPWCTSELKELGP